MVTNIDYLRCPDGRLHEWLYMGKARSLYRCTRCPVEVKKTVLKRETDA